MSLFGLENSKYQGTKRWVVYAVSSFWCYEHQIGPAPTHTELTQYELLSETPIYSTHKCIYSILEQIIGLVIYIKFLHIKP